VAEYGGAYPSSIVKFNGYYIGEIIDPVGNYINVRKGPGTNNPIVRRVHTKDWCFDNERYGHPTDSGRFFYQKTNSNWWKLYDKPDKFIIYIYTSTELKKMFFPNITKTLSSITRLLKTRGIDLISNRIEL
jgi:hypothetical protein